MLKVIFIDIFNALSKYNFPFRAERVIFTIASSTYNRLYRLLAAVSTFGANPITGGGGRLIICSRAQIAILVFSVKSPLDVTSEE